METTQTTESSPTTQSALVTLTEAAVVEVSRLMDVQDLTEGGLRLGVKGGRVFRFKLYDQFRRQNRRVRYGV